MTIVRLIFNIIPVKIWSGTHKFVVLFGDKVVGLYILHSCDQQLSTIQHIVYYMKWGELNLDGLKLLN